MMLDAHCHLDRYDDPKMTASEAAAYGVLTIAMTNLPSHFQVDLPHVRRLPRVRLALGLHPLAARCHVREYSLFRELLHTTSYVGEVGLDFSKEGFETREDQLRSFRLVAESISSEPKFLSLHSRRAESVVLDILSEYGIHAAVFHWYGGPLALLEEALSRGHFFSVNPAMVLSAKGKHIIERIPINRLLTESDGPYVTIGRTPARPQNVRLVEKHLEQLWGMDGHEVQKRVWLNFQFILLQLGLAAAPREKRRENLL